MAEQYALQSAFNSGEWSPKLLGQVDLKKYRDACQVLENMLVYPHGPAFVRSGFKFIAALQNSASQGRLDEFIFSNLESYIVIWESGLFWLINGQTPVVDQNGNLLVVPSPYQVSDLPYIQSDQSFDIKYCVHPNYPPYKMIRSSSTAFSLSPISYADGPYMNQNSDPTIYMQLGSISNTGSSQASAVLNVVGSGQPLGFNPGQQVSVKMLSHGTGNTVAPEVSVNGP